MIIGFSMGPLKAGDGGGVLDSISSCSEASSAASSDSDLTDEATSSCSSSSPPPSSSSSVGDPLRDMSSLMEQLPIKRGLSRYFQGKSQSFTSLSNVRSLEDLAKPENPYNKRLKSCRSYAGLADSHSSSSSSSLLPRTSSSSRFNPKKTSASSSRVSCSSSSAKRNSNGSFARPPMAAPPPPHRSASASSFNSNQTPLFA